MCSHIPCCTLVVILKLVFKAKLRSYQQQYSQQSTWCLYNRMKVGITKQYCTAPTMLITSPAN